MYVCICICIYVCVYIKGMEVIVGYSYVNILSFSLCSTFWSSVVANCIRLLYMKKKKNVAYDVVVVVALIKI